MSAYDKMVLSMCNGNDRHLSSSDGLCSSHLSNNGGNSGHHSSSVKHGQCSSLNNDLNMNGDRGDNARTCRKHSYE